MSAASIETINLSVLDAGKTLGNWSQRINLAFLPAVKAVAVYLDIKDIDVVVYPSKFVIPEIGMNAYTENAHLIRFWIDPDHIEIASHFDLSFPALMAHEFHHAMRARGPGYRSTLRAALISEGLACCFEEQVTGRLPIYGVPLEPAEFEDGLQCIAPFLDGPYSPDWMFGSQQHGIERSFGYRLGSTIVGRWLEQRRLTAAAAVYIETQEICGMLA